MIKPCTSHNKVLLVICAVSVDVPGGDGEDVRVLDYDIIKERRKKLLLDIVSSFCFSPLILDIFIQQLAMK